MFNNYKTATVSERAVYELGTFCTESTRIFSGNFLLITLANDNPAVSWFITASCFLVISALKLTIVEREWTPLSVLEERLQPICFNELLKFEGRTNPESKIALYNTPSIATS